MKINYYNLMVEKIKSLENRKPKLLLHVCCAPCSSHVLLTLKDYFDISVYFYNPNIYPESEFSKRLDEEIKLLKNLNLNYSVFSPGYNSSEFYDKIKGYEHLGEKSERCNKCFELRLEKTAKYARENDYDFFTTTLTISPLKDAEILNTIGEKIGKKYGVEFLNSDFKKKDGYKYSILLSNKYNLYRQNYCGCIFSMNESEKRFKN